MAEMGGGGRLDERLVGAVAAVADPCEGCGAAEPPATLPLETPQIPEHCPLTEQSPINRPTQGSFFAAIQSHRGRIC